MLMWRAFRFIEQASGSKLCGLLIHSRACILLKRTGCCCFKRETDEIVSTSEGAKDEEVGGELSALLSVHGYGS